MVRSRLPLLLAAVLLAVAAPAAVLAQAPPVEPGRLLATQGIQAQPRGEIQMTGDGLSESYVSIMGASASSSSSDQHAGQWWLVANLAGGATLLLEATDGRYFRWQVEEAGDGYIIDGYRYVLSGSC